MLTKPIGSVSCRFLTTAWFAESPSSLEFQDGDGRDFYSSLKLIKKAGHGAA